MTKHSPILIIGMARSGTSLVSHILGSLANVHIEVEPHALWKSGNFKYFNDEEYDMKPAIINRIRNKFKLHSLGKTLVEKSPINVLRPHLVHAVFPEAKVVYVERNPVRCIYSNYIRSLSKDSLKPSIVFRKYFIYTGSKDLSGAISYRKLHQQLSVKDVPAFTAYITKMLYHRQFKTLPFGPKLKNFPQIIKEKGLLEYHVEVYKRSLEYKEILFNLYKSNIEIFSMEKITSNISEIKRMVEFTGLGYTNNWGQHIQQSLSSDRVVNAVTKRKEDIAIEKMLAR